MKLYTTTKLQTFHDLITESDFHLMFYFYVGERPPSSMSPVILESKSGGLLIIGGSGGSLITPAMALVIQ